MQPPAVIATPRNARKHTAGRTAVSLGLALTVLAAPLASTTLPAAARFTMGIEARTFDGAAFNVIRWESQVITLTAFTLGAWTPIDAPQSPFGMTLQHQRETAVKLGISPLTGELVPSDEDRWSHYVATMAANLGLDIGSPEEVDSRDAAAHIAVLNWPSREVVFNDPASETEEIHLVAATGDLGVVFVLSGPAAAVERTRQDFRFFLSRLDRK